MPPQAGAGRVAGDGRGLAPGRGDRRADRRDPAGAAAPGRPGSRSGARDAERLAQRAQEAEADRRREAETAQYQASGKALGAIQALADAKLSQARVLRFVGQPGRQARALDLIGSAARSRSDADVLVAGLRNDPDRLGPANASFWSDRLPPLRDEATRWLTELSVLPLTPVRFARPRRDRNTHEMFVLLTLQDRLALDPDGSVLAYVRTAARDGTSGRFEELVLVETATGKVLNRIRATADRASNPGLVTPRFTADGATLLLALLDRSGPRPTAQVRSLRSPSGEVVKTVELEPPPLPPGQSLPPGASAWIFAPQLQRLVFSPDGRFLLGISPGGPFGGGPGATDTALVWDVADGRLPRPPRPHRSSRASAARTS